MCFIIDFTISVASLCCIAAVWHHIQGPCHPPIDLERKRQEQLASWLPAAQATTLSWQHLVAMLSQEEVER
jgi:hypothetical protein